MNDLASLTAQITEQLGVVDVDTHDRVVTATSGLLADLGHDASVVELRHGTLVLAADPLTAGLLRYDLDRILEQLASGDGPTVRRISIHTR